MKGISIEELISEYIGKDEYKESIEEGRRWFNSLTEDQKLSMFVRADKTEVTGP